MLYEPGTALPWSDLDLMEKYESWVIPTVEPSNHLHAPCSRRWCWLFRLDIVPMDRDAFPLPLFFRHGVGERPNAANLRVLLIALNVLLKLTSATEPGALVVSVLSAFWPPSTHTLTLCGICHCVAWLGCVGRLGTRVKQMKRLKQRLTLSRSPSR